MKTIIYSRVMKSGRVCEFKYSPEDHDLVSSRTWRVDSRGYIRNDKWLNGKVVCTYLHREICGNPYGMQIDHKSGDRSDNRRENLREATPEQNGRNRKIDSRSKTKTTGVYWDSYSRKWRAHISIDKNQVQLGSFSNIKDAIKVRKIAESTYYKEFAKGAS